MRKLTCFMFIFVLSAAVFAQEWLYNIDEMMERTVFIDGHTIDPGMRDFFVSNFQIEAVGLGWEVTNMRDAAFNFHFTVGHNMVQFVDGSVARAPLGEPQYLITIIFTRNFDNVEIVRYNFPFTFIQEMYDYNQLLFFRSIINVPFPVETETIIITETIYIDREVEVERTGFNGFNGWLNNENHDWRNKWLYLRLSLDNPVTFFNRLNDDSLLYEDRVFNTDGAGNVISHRVNNRVVSMPGLTVGLEVQPLNWLSFEPHFRVHLGDPVNEDDIIFNMFVGLSVKFPIKLINNTKISPFLGFSYALSPLIMPSDTFYTFPPLEIGAGVQVNLRSGRRNAMFFQASYMQTLGNVIMHNQYVNFPNPAVIPYRRFAINIGIGYKFGFITRTAR